MNNQTNAVAQNLDRIDYRVQYSSLDSQRLLLQMKNTEMKGPLGSPRKNENNTTNCIGCLYRLKSCGEHEEARWQYQILPYWIIRLVHIESLGEHAGCSDK